jgi:hypothetical protein
MRPLVPRGSHDEAPHRALRSPGHVVVISKNAIQHDVRTSSEPGYRFPISMKIVAGQNPSLHVFEYRGETLYMHEAHGLMDATTEVEPDPLLEP